MGRLNTTTALAAAAVALVAAGCATTAFKSTWKAPDAQPLALAGKKVGAMVIHNNEGTRRAAEDALAREITARGAQGQPTYPLLSNTAAKDQATAKAAIEKAGFDGLVVMRPVGREKEVTYTPGVWTGQPMYGSFWGGYYGYGWGAAYSPGYLQTDTIVSVETLIYSTDQDKLIWAGESTTTNPTKVDSFVRELSGKVATELRREGLLAK
jgi:hypothetical protein